jgi:hypothetical protein
MNEASVAATPCRYTRGGRVPPTCDHVRALGQSLESGMASSDPLEGPGPLLGEFAEKTLAFGHGPKFAAQLDHTKAHRA